jgi:hypothetical protein
LADSILTRIKNAWNIFRHGDDRYTSVDIGAGGGYSQSQIMIFTPDRTMITAIYNRIAIDVAAIKLQHAKTDENGSYLEDVLSGINNCLTVEANIDQSGRQFIQQVAMLMCSEGYVAIVPVDTTKSPRVTGSYDVLTMRPGIINQWYSEHVKVEVYNRKIGDAQTIVVPKTQVAIVQNPLYSVMNEPNSTLQRLIEKISLLDVIDKQSGSGKLDLIIQLPYVIKSDKKQEQADKRKAAIESQLADSQYGIAYVDATEKIHQLNRPAENNLMTQIEYLTSMLWSQLGLTQAVFDGTADEVEMINYYNRTIEPFLSAIANAMNRVFLTKTARSQGQTIMPIRDPFKLVSTEALAELSDKLTRNEIVTSNELRAVIGMKPSKDPRADELRNKNLNQNTAESVEDGPVEKQLKPNQNGRSMVKDARN